MEMLNDVLPVILYVLLAILVVVLIIFVVRLIRTLGKVDRVVDGVNARVGRLDSVFNIIDAFTDGLTLMSDKFANFAIEKIGSLFRRKSKKRKDEEYE